MQCLKECAEANCVSERTVRNWRKAEPQDPRWLSWRAAWAKKHDPAQFIEPAGDVQADSEDDGLGEGIEAEIKRTKAECKRLAIRANYLEKNEKFEGAALIHRILDAKRDGLRKLAGDNPDILARSGDLIPRADLFQYVAAVKAMISALPKRLLAAVPAELRDQVRGSLDAECAAVLAAAQEIELSPA